MRRANWRRFAGQDVEQQAAERVDVDAAVDVLVAAQLLGRHVAGCAERDAALVARPIELARDAPVEHVDLAAVTKEHVRRFEIAVRDSIGVCDLDRVTDVDERA